MDSTPKCSADRPRWRGTLLAAAEVTLIFLLFFIHAGWQPPDVNEAHYLAKAKHFWNPDWCPGDFFLESADAHRVFYYTFGWLTRFFSLAGTAWIGRLVTWGLLAAGWRRLSFAVIPKPLFSVLTASLFLCFLSRCHMAGEWVVGGVEAKGMAYVLTFFALAELVYGRWNWCFLLLGAASAFHALVGGWSVIAAGGVWILSPGERPKLTSILPGLILGGLLALPGLLPVLALNRGADPAVVRQAAQIYVFERLDHHLLLQGFKPWFIGRFLVTAGVWLNLCWFLPGESGTRRLWRFVLCGVMIAIVGGLIEAATSWNPGIAASWMRFYWYRLADVAVPLGLAMAVGAWIVYLPRLSRPVLANCVLMAAMAVAAFSVLEHFLYNQLYRTGDPDHINCHQKHRDWQQICQWIDENLPSDASFLTPRYQQTFKWYAGRSEVFNWKDVPQDAEKIVQWDQRHRDVFRTKSQIPGRRWRRSLTTIDIDTLHDLAQKYDFRFLVVDLTVRSVDHPDRDVVPLVQNGSFAVFRLRRPKDRT
jgi:hypothetical protein